MIRTLLTSLSFCALTALPATPARADTPPPQNLLHLSADASAELPNDWLGVTLAITREGPEAAAVQDKLRDALDAALALARPAAKGNGSLEVRTGAFHVGPRYSPRGGTDGWTGTAELVLEGRDTAAIAQLIGRIKTLTVSQVSWSLSRQAREKVEHDLAERAVAAFRAKADAAARWFGFSSWLLREATIASDTPGRPPVPMMRARASAMAAAEALPVESGNSTVTSTVQGSVQLTR